MDGLTLLNRARAAGLTVSAHDGVLNIKGPPRADALARELIEHKPEILAALDTPGASMEAVETQGPATGPWRRPAELADWPIPWRQRFGLRANELSDAGIPRPDDERLAFEEVLRERQSGAEPPPIAAPPASSPRQWRVVVDDLLGNCLLPDEHPEPSRYCCQNPFCKNKNNWWLSSAGVLNCENCVPPAFPELVVARGSAEDAPLVEPGRSTTIAGPWPQGDPSCRP
jgi:hypothetical protein